MIIISELLPEIFKTFNLLERGNLIPFNCPYRIPKTFDKISIPTFVAGSKYMERQWKCHIFILVLASLFGVYRYIMESKTVMGKTLAAWNDLTLLIHAFWGHYFHRESTALAHFFNQIVKFENIHVTGTIHGNDIPKFRTLIGSKGAVSLVKAMRTSVGFVCIMLSSSGFLFPKAAWSLLPNCFFGTEIPFMILQDNRYGRLLLNISQRIMSFLFTYASWRSLCNIGIVCVVINLTIGTYCLSATLATFKWKCCHGKLNPLQLCLIYRKIQLISKLYNELHKKCVIMGFIIYMPACVSVCIYLVASRWNEFDVMALLMFSNYAQAAAVVILFVFQYAVKVFTYSMNIQRCIPPTRANGQVALVKRYWKSFQVVKVTFFSNNFFESTTPMLNESYKKYVWQKIKNDNAQWYFYNVLLTAIYFVSL